MAENNQRSYRDPRLRGTEETPRAQGDDPLAELARLIGQSAPMDRLGRDRGSAAPAHADDQPQQTERGAGYPEADAVRHDPPDDQYPAAADGPYQQDVDEQHRVSGDEGYEPIAEPAPTPPPRASRFRQEPRFASARSYDASDAADESAYRDTAEWDERSADESESHYADEYEDDRHDAQGYGDDYDEDQGSGRRGGFVFVVAVFALAVLGTAGAFGYRAMFGGPALPSLPPIIKAEGGPNKIMPKDGSAQAARDSADNAGSAERLVSREERPVDIPPPVTSTAPRSVATVPVFPDPPSMGGPGAVVGYSAKPSLSNAASAAEPPPFPSASAMTTASAPNLAPSGAQASSASAVPPASAVPSAATSSVPGAPGPKKIRTVTIRTDQPAAADAPTNQANAPRPGAQSQSANGPLSIVPSSTETPAAAPRPRTANPQPAAPQPVPLNKPPANQTASVAPVATAGAGYAVQVSSQHSEEEAQSSFRALQAKYPDLLGGREPIIRRADLGAKGIYFRAMVGPFASADQANELCSNLKAAGGNCLVQKN
jgi:hypothetical protein